MSISTPVVIDGASARVGQSAGARGSSSGRQAKMIVGWMDYTSWHVECFSAAMLLWLNPITLGSGMKRANSEDLPGAAMSTCNKSASDTARLMVIGRAAIPLRSSPSLSHNQSQTAAYMGAALRRKLSHRGARGSGGSLAPVFVPGDYPAFSSVSSDGRRDA